jgi:methylamine---glutamate N-methyltransferase subunit B
MTDSHKEELLTKLKAAGIAGQVDVGEFKRYGSARDLYHFHVDHASSY